MANPTKGHSPNLNKGNPINIACDLIYTEERACEPYEQCTQFPSTESNKLLGNLTCTKPTCIMANNTYCQRNQPTSRNGDDHCVDISAISVVDSSIRMDFGLRRQSTHPMHPSELNCKLVVVSSGWKYKQSTHIHGQVSFVSVVPLLLLLLLLLLNIMAILSSPNVMILCGRTKKTIFTTHA